MKFSIESLYSVWSMAQRLGTSGRTSGQQDISDELQINRASKFLESHEFPSSKPCIDKRHEVRRRAVNAHLVQLKTSKNFQKQQLGSVSKGDELVKHMSNLPVYLQRAENEKSVQEKALNFGVLDWKRLENWKLNESMPARSHRKSSSAVSDSLAVTSKSSSQEQKLEIDNEVNLAPKPQNIVSLSPKPKHSRRSYSGIPQISESRTLPNGDSVEPEKNRDSGSYKELYPTTLSCSLPVNESSSSKSGGKQQNSYAHDRNSDLPTCHNQDDMPTLPTQTEDKCHPKTKPSLTSLDSFETSQKTDLDIAGQHPSHNRKFSFSLSRLSRSFTSKQTSVLPELSATKTIPKNPPHFMDSDTRDKANASGGGRSSPLRRLLNPLARSKTSKPPNGTLSSVTMKPTTNSNENVSAKKHEISTSEALLHLTCRDDGLPFFKFVANNGNDVLAAAVNKLPTSGKGGGCLIYSFCKVSVMKKKTGGWVGQGSKEKCSGLGYNIIGMMKVSSSEDESVVRESVLYSVDFGQGDKQAPEFLPNKELAAIMVRNQMMKHNKGDIVVILPGAIHGLPHKGAPSSLIERWRSGGSCDCGGWDVGCKLRVLAGDNHENQDSITTLVQRGEEEKKPVFWLSPLKNGVYSVQYDASITLLETFSACVAILTSQKLSHILEVPKQEKIISASSTTIQGRGPARYVLSPPLSPVARI
ncbi:PREDICTED: uncharacterized protein LOC109182319 isoform X2 [Ipomoea nil]|uniref:uncharacterized protein LOC109182319 isoform X2 n=1 Tax=Ipomoea nil TaxID=35883 RepID=UPI000900CDED|nr:PREDICTED: uncharacterized protein LOC109182319 isoform X2 [Ipomoea nil]